MLKIILNEKKLSMSLKPLLKCILGSNWDQKVVQIKEFPSNEKITNFGNLPLISSTEISGVKNGSKNEMMFSTITISLCGQ